jgi:hypothetical protein
MNETAKIAGNEADGWNVVADLDGHRVTMACEDREDAEDLLQIVRRLSWESVVPLPKVGA